jgi:hypothetical protein
MLDEITEIYKPIVASFGGAVLTLERQWTNPEVNAWAYRPGDKIWRVVVTGGIARRPEVTQDAFVMAVCHEIGHFLGGFPQYEFSWSSAEGQADYYATQTCTKLVWSKDVEENAAARALIDETPKNHCDNYYDNEAEQNLCYRQMLAAASLARILKVIGRETVDASFDTPDPSQVAKTYTGHPKAQCRLDTYLAGAICDIKTNPTSFPNTEEGAALTSCMESSGYTIEARPRCWFRPKL